MHLTEALRVFIAAETLAFAWRLFKPLNGVSTFMLPPASHGTLGKTPTAMAEATGATPIISSEAIHLYPGTHTQTLFHETGPRYLGPRGSRGCCTVLCSRKSPILAADHLDALLRGNLRILQSFRQLSYILPVISPSFRFSSSRSVSFLFARATREIKP